MTNIQIYVSTTLWDDLSYPLRRNLCHVYNIKGISRFKFILSDNLHTILKGVNTSREKYK